MENVGSLARRTAVGMAAQVASGNDDEANLLLHLYLKETHAAGVMIPVALVALVKTLISMGVAVAGEDATEVFARMASSIVMAES